MIKLYTFTIYTLLSLNACGADSNLEFWSETTEKDKFYLMKNSVSPDGQTVRATFVQDLSKPKQTERGKVLSHRITYEYDCKALSEKTYYINGYSGQMGYGKELFRYPAYLGSQHTYYSKIDWTNQGYNKFCKKDWEFWK